jgi:sortase A
MKAVARIGSTARILAIVCLGIYLAARADAEFGRVQGIAAFQAAGGQSPATAIGDYESVTPDQSHWSAGRIHAYLASLASDTGIPLGLLRVADIDLVVPVYPGTGELALNRGLGWIEGTSRPGEDGNVGIAGHRDGFFRGLQDVGPGDVVELETAGSTRRYRVDSIQIVEPNAVHVLAPTDKAVLTLVTCYPFYHVGPAPQRFIVRAGLDRDAT